MALPQAIPARYTEEEAGYVSFRPVVRQTFRLNELLDLVLSVTGKNPARVQQILRSGTVVYHAYRYRWEGFEAGDAELNALLACFPDPDPSREFSRDACTLALVGGGGPPARVLLEVDRLGASRTRLLRRRSFWDAMLAAASAGPLDYSGYSYAHRADLYRLELTSGSRETLAAAAQLLAPRSLRLGLRVLANASHVVFICPRKGC